jgi:hypothetical protein
MEKLCTVFQESSLYDLKLYKDKLIELLDGAIYSKEYKLYLLTDKELNQLGEDNYQHQRYMRRSEDTVETSSDENKRGFNQEWSELEKEEEGIRFEVSRRTFLDKRKES